MLTQISKKINIGLPTGTMAITAALLLGLGSTKLFAKAVVETGAFMASDLFYKVIDKDMAKITFDKGDSKLSDTAIATLAEFLKQVGSNAKVDRFLVATWSDEAYPTKGKLLKAPRRLANLRSENIKKGLYAKGVTNVDFFEMTEKPNWIQEFFSTKTAEVKNKGSNRTQQERLLKEIGNTLRAKGGPGTAVIVAKFRNEVVAE